jgi:TonB family protein
MRTFLLATCAALALSGAAYAQQPAQPPPQPAPAGDAAEVLRLNEQIVGLYRERKFDEALALAGRALDLAERAGGPEGRLVADVLANQAEALLAKEEYARAEAALRRALAIYEKADGPGGPRARLALMRLAVAQFRRGDQAGAEDTARAAATLAEGTHGAPSAEAARAWVMLAEMLRLRGERVRAQEAYGRVLAAAEKLAPDAVPADVTQGLANYLGLLYARGKDDDEPVKRVGKIMSSVAAAHAGKHPAVIESGVIDSRVAYKPGPAYPPGARAARESGWVLVSVVVDETGRVVEAKSAAAPMYIRASSQEAARRARFTPTVIAGVPVKIAGTIVYKFVLN